MINIYTDEEIALMRQGGKILAKILKAVAAEIKTGRTGVELDQKARDLIKKMGAKPSFLGYKGFPAALCVSTNNQLVHGIPSRTPFQKGDLVSLDLGVEFRGFCTDKAMTVLVEDGDKKKLKFIKTVKESLEKGIRQARLGNSLGAISHAIFKTLQGGGYYVIRDLSGHGIGRSVHEDPRIFNFGNKNQGPILKQGMVLAIEPMVSLGTTEIVVEKDNSTIASKDGSLCAHFEDTVAVTKNGPLVLTLQ